MLQYFRRKKAISGKIELVSVHIPKTAGTSFRHSLLTAYGKKAVARLDIHLEDETIKLNERRFQESQFPASIKVLHGHFSPYLLRKHFALEPKIPFITWLRDPVERVASNYFYLSQRLKEELQEERKQLNILSKMQRSLLEYAQADINRNRMHDFLHGMLLSEFTFVGIQEHFSEDLATLADLMNWKSPTVFHHNKTASYKLSEEERRLIGSWNQLDVKLYQDGLKLRKERLAEKR
jgi:hypothetical protein